MNAVSGRTVPCIQCVHLCNHSWEGIVSGAHQECPGFKLQDLWLRYTSTYQYIALEDSTGVSQSCGSTKQVSVLVGCNPESFYNYWYEVHKVGTRLAIVVRDHR